MGVRVERDDGFGTGNYDEYPDAGSWFVAANGELQIYLGTPQEDDESLLLAEYGAGKFIRVMRHPLATPPQPAPDDEKSEPRGINGGL